MPISIFHPLLLSLPAMLPLNHPPVFGNYTLSKICFLIPSDVQVAFSAFRNHLNINEHKHLLTLLNNYIKYLTKIIGYCIPASVMLFFAFLSISSTTSFIFLAFNLNDIGAVISNSTFSFFFLL